VIGADITVGAITAATPIATFERVVPRMKYVLEE
jgi:hypothetical protein